MQFPTWADSPKMTKHQRAVGRLKCIVMRLSIEHTGRNSMRAFGALVGLDHSTLSKYIKQGHFTEKAACQVQVRLGDPTITAEDLMNPLGIKPT